MISFSRKKTLLIADSDVAVFNTLSKKFYIYMYSSVFICFVIRNKIVLLFLLPCFHQRTVEVLKVKLC
jgi:hypothetical protein